MSHEQADVRSEDIFSLASAFARNELDEGGQQQLLSALRDPQHGSAAAQEAWRALAMHTDLRSSLGGEVFRDAIVTRLEEGRNRSFMQSLWQRLGWSQARLDPVSPPPAGTHQGRHRWLILFFGILALILLTSILWWPRGDQASAQVVAISGTVRYEGTRLSQSSGWLAPGILSIERNSSLQLAMGDSSVLIHGPAQASIGRSAIGLSSGRALLSNGEDDLVVGSPHETVVISANSQAMAEVIEGHLSLGIIGGDGAEIRPASNHAYSLAVGQASHQGQVFAWEQHSPTPSILWRIPNRPDAHLWRAQALWQPGASPRLSLLDEHGQVLARIEADSVYIAGQRYPLHGPPRSQRNIHIEHSLQRNWLRLDGWQGSLPLATRVDRIFLDDGAEGGSLSRLQWWTGPQHPEK